MACHGLIDPLRSIQKVKLSSTLDTGNQLINWYSSRVRVYDYQAVCKDFHGHRSAANFLLTPIRYMRWFVQWIIGRATWLLLQTQVAHLINPDWAWAMEQDQDYNYEEESSPCKFCCATRALKIRSIWMKNLFYFSSTSGRRIHG